MGLHPCCIYCSSFHGTYCQQFHLINAISAGDIPFIMSSSQAIVNRLNALDQSDFS